MYDAILLVSFGGPENRFGAPRAGHIHEGQDVLTAEGRISAYVLGALPLFLLFPVSTISPGYMAPLFRGWGYVWLGVTGASVLTGVGIILNMVKIEV